MPEKQKVTNSFEIIKSVIEELDSDFRLSLPAIAARLELDEEMLNNILLNWISKQTDKPLEYFSPNYFKRMQLVSKCLVGQATVTSISYNNTPKFGSRKVSIVEFKDRQSNLEVFYNWIDGPFGPTLVFLYKNSICGLAFAPRLGCEATFFDMIARWPNATFYPTKLRQDKLIKFVFSAKGLQTLSLIGSPFQIKVWRALMTIPIGSVTSYSHIADAIKRPKAVRAVGNAVGRNPIGWLVPCHRAILKTGAIGDYYWGLTIKKALLVFEANAKIQLPKAKAFS